MRSSKKMQQRKEKSIEDPSYIYISKKKKPESELKFPKWSLEENEIYIEFLEENLSTIENREGRKARCFYKLMSMRMNGVKNNEQCRSHHQKMIKHYHNPRRIINHFRGEISSQKNDNSLQENR